MKHRRALNVAVVAAALLALSGVRFSPDDAIPITGLLVGDRRWRDTSLFEAHAAERLYPKLMARPLEP